MALFDLRKDLDPLGEYDSLDDSSFVEISDHLRQEQARAAGGSAPSDSPVARPGLRPAPEKPIQPMPHLELAAQGPMVAAPLAALGAARDVMQQDNPLQYLLDTPGRGIKGGFDILRGVGLGLAGAVNVVTTGAMLAPVPGNPFYNPAQGAERTMFGARAIAHALPEVRDAILKNLGEEVTNPGAAFIRRPTETALDASAALDLPSTAASAVGRIAAMRGMREIALRIAGREGVAAVKNTAKGAMQMSEAMSPHARNALVWETLREDSRTGPWVMRQENIWKTRDIVANRAKEAALKTEAGNAADNEVFRGMNAKDNEAAQAIAMGMASPAPTAPEKIARAAAFHREDMTAEQAGLFATGQLDPAAAERRAWQPVRLATGGDEQLAMEKAPRRMNDVTGLEKRAAVAEKARDAALKKAQVAGEREAEASRLKDQLAQSRRETLAAQTAERKGAYFKGRSEQGQRGLTPLEDIDARIAETKESLKAARQSIPREAQAERATGRLEGTSQQAQKHLAELDNIDAQISEWKQRAANEALPERKAWDYSENEYTQKREVPIRRLEGGTEPNAPQSDFSDPRRIAAENIGRLKELRKTVLANMRDVARAEGELEVGGAKAAASRSGSATQIYRQARQLGRDEAIRERLVKQAGDVTTAELGREAAATEAAAARAATPGSPTQIAQNLGKTKARLSEAQRWQAHADMQEARRVRLIKMADEKRGRTPALDRIDAVTAGLNKRAFVPPDESTVSAFVNKVNALNSPDVQLEIVGRGQEAHLVSIRSENPIAAGRTLIRIKRLAQEYGVPITGEAMPLDAGGQLNSLDLPTLYGKLGAQPVEGTPFMRLQPEAQPGLFEKNYPDIFDRVRRGEIAPGAAIHEALGPGTIIEPATQAQMETRLSAEAAAAPLDPGYVPIVGKGKWYDRLVPPEFRANLPAYLRRSTGESYMAGDFERSLPKVRAIHRANVIQNEKNLGILTDVVQDPSLATPLKSFKDLPEGQSLIAPGAYARNMVDNIHPVDAALRSPNPEEALNAAARGVIIPDGTDMEGLAESMGPFYAVPKEVAEELHGQMGGWYAGLPPAMRFAGRMAFDKPNEFARWFYLTLRPGFYVNNLVGNTAMAGLAGATGQSVAAAAGGEATPIIARGIGFAASEAPALPTFAGRAARIRSLSNLANEGVDELARKGVFLGNVDRIALRKSIMETGKRMDKAMSYAEKMEYIGPEGVNRAAQVTSEFLNDYANQAPWQKNLLRNVLPFQSFTVHMSKLITRLPVTHPLRAELVAKFAELSNEYQAQGFEQAGIDPSQLRSYRLGLLPVNGDHGEVTTLGTAGFNPTSGLGTSSAEMAYDPSVEGLARAVAGGANPLIQYGEQVFSGENALGQTYTKPGTYRAFGRDQAYNAQGQPTRQPIPTPWDFFRNSFAPVKIGEALAQPNETYDLVGGLPFTSNYLPESGAGPRKYDAGAMLNAYTGFPFRTFGNSDMVISETERKTRAKIANDTRANVVELRKQIRDAESVLSAAKAAQDTAEVARQKLRLKQLHNQIKRESGQTP